ncbi:MAG: hypothetical protein AB8G99_24505 [Planctomycetaceae bacterium]
MEERTLLAGNVLASFAGGTLTITGNSANNSIRIQRAPIASPAILVEGLDTTVNERVFDTFPLDSIDDFRDLKIDMQGGNDTVFNFLSVGRNMTVEMGPGADQLENPVAIGGNLKLDLGSSISAANDQATIGGSIGGSATIVGGAGGQAVTLQADVSKNVKVNLGSSRVSDLTSEFIDLFEVAEGTIGGSLTVTGSSGSQRATLTDATVRKNAKFNLGDDSDAVVLIDQDGRTNVRGNVTAKLGDGLDGFIMGNFLAASANRVGKNLKIDMGSSPGTSFADIGTTEVALLDGEVGGSVSVKAGAGSQIVGFSGLTVQKNATVKLGNGDDLFLSGPDTQPTIRGRFTVDGGNGSDTVRDLFVPFRENNIETFEF